MRYATLSGLFLTSAALLGACQTAKPVVQKQTPAPGGITGRGDSSAAPTDAWRPDWWIDRPARAKGGNSGTTVAAFGTDVDLLAARKKAMDDANRQLHEILGSTPDAVPARADTIRLPEGTYRTFVLVTVAPPSGS